MKVELNKKDLISLVMGIVPPYSVYNEPLVKKCGEHCGGFVDRWDWDNFELEKLTEEELYELYNICKEGWNV